MAAKAVDTLVARLEKCERHAGDGDVLARRQAKAFQVSRSFPTLLDTERKGVSQVVSILCHVAIQQFPFHVSERKLPAPGLSNSSFRWRLPDADVDHPNLPGQAPFPSPSHLMKQQLPSTQASFARLYIMGCCASHVSTRYRKLPETLRSFRSPGRDLRFL